MFTKVLVGAAIALGCCVAAGAPAGAETTSELDQSVFGALTCSCSQTAPPAGSALSEINRGLQNAAATFEASRLPLAGA